MTHWRRLTFRLAALAAAFAVIGQAGPARAEDKSGVSPAHVKLPRGPGSLEGLGENVEPNLAMGLMSYGIPIEVPGGYPGLGPSLRLVYSSGNAASVVGIGWSLAAPSIERMTSQRLPSYDLDDRFAAGGSDELVRVDESENAYRARFEGGFVRYTWEDAGDGREGYFVAEYPDGRIGYFGARAGGTPVPDARLEGPSGTFRYYLVEMRDTLDHRTVYEYSKVDETPLLERVAYVWNGDEPRYEVELRYEERPDFVSDAKPGFETLLTERLRDVVVLARGEQLRRYRLEYEEHTGLSRLSSVATFGRDDDDGAYPIAFGFGYSGGAGQSCSLGTCAAPALYEIAGASGVDFRTNAADLVDLNGDGLPDIVDTSTERHTVYLNEIVTSGSERTQELSRAESTGGSLDLRAGNVRLFDLDGDGFSDMVDALSQRVLFNEGAGDWLEERTLDALDMPNLAEDANARLVDVTNDGCIDVLHLGLGEAWYFQSDCAGGFTLVEDGVSSVGASFAESGLELADMNGDGLQDLVLVAPELVAYFLNLGQGRFGERREMLGVPENVDTGFQLVELSGDGLADLVRVAGDTVSFALNRNGREFEALESLSSSASLPIPELLSDTSLRFADMNGSGSTDVVWIDSSGGVVYLELFPERPNLLTSVTNGIGKETLIEYGSTGEHMARDGGPGAWRYRVPHPMLTVDAIRTRDELSETEQLQRFRYRDGYYDPVEKQFRGFEQVELSTAGDDASEPRRDLYTFDAGIDEDGERDPYRKGLLLRHRVYSGDPERAVEETENDYARCDLDGVPDTEPPVRFVCSAGLRRIVKEGASERSWVTIEERYAYDGYGNRTLTEKQGVTERGGGGCGACLDGGAQGAPCGDLCTGDEAYEETEFVRPNRTGGRWLVNKPSSKKSYAVPGSETYALERYYYDEQPLGELEVGLLTGTEARAAAGTFVWILRTTYDEHGAPLQVIDANDHRRSLGHDADGLLVTSETVELADYDLTVELEYDPVLDEITASSAWSLGQVDPERITRYAYDGFGRLVAMASPGDTLDEPTEEYRYELGAPVSRIVTRRRSESGGPADLERVQCFDGLGRELQTRTLLEAGRYQVSGFTAYDAAGRATRSYYPYQSPADTCATRAPAEEVPATRTSYDGTGRVLVVEHPAESADATPSHSEKQYLPLETWSFDEEDTDPGSPHADTPSVLRQDGLGRSVEFVRHLDPERAVPLHIVYDELGNLGGYVDAQGNRKSLAYDMLKRLVRVDDPDAGRTTFERDPAGNIVAQTDARDVTIQRTYDAANRVLREWEEGDPDGTEIRYAYDVAEDCDACTNAAGLPVSVAYPLPGEPEQEGIDRFGYDLRGRQTYARRRVGARDFELGVSFDNVGRVVARHYPSGLSLGYAYDGADRLISVPGYAERVDYGERGLLEGMGLGNGVETSYGYDGRMRLASLDTELPNGDALQAYEFTRDRAGNLLELADASDHAGGPSLAARYTYDAWYRLTSALLNRGGDDEEGLEYAYDDIDNLTEKISDRGAESREHVGEYGYGEDGAGPHAATTAGSHTLEYDAAGQLARRDDDDYAWDFLGRMTRSRRNGAETARFSYAAGDARVKKSEGAQTTYYFAPEFEVRDGVATLYVEVDGRRVAKLEVTEPEAAGLPDLAPVEVESGKRAELRPDGRISAADAWIAQAAEVGVYELSADPNADVDQLLAAAARRALFGFEGGEPKVTYFQHDHLGSLVAVTDSGGELVEERAQYPYGLDRDAGVPLEAEYLFTGKETDVSTGLTYFGARYLDPELGRWTSADPLFLEEPGKLLERPFEGANPYAYVSNGPTGRTDATGREITITRQKDAAGTWQTRITFTAVLINDSTTAMTPKQLKAYTQQIKSAIEKTYTKTWAGGAENLVTTATVYTKKPAAGAANLHEIHIRDTVAGKANVLGQAPFGKKQIDLNVGLFTKKWGNAASLGRTAAHEFGHSANLRHPNDPNNPLVVPAENLMSQTAVSSSRTVQFQQVMEMYKQRANLNQ